MQEKHEMNNRSDKLFDIGINKNRIISNFILNLKNKTKSQEVSKTKKVESS